MAIVLRENVTNLKRSLVHFHFDVVTITNKMYSVLTFFIINFLMICAQESTVGEISICLCISFLLVGIAKTEYENQIFGDYEDR